ncbi:MAG: diacylglycerol kinase family protein [Myxococcota bacterium]
MRGLIVANPAAAAGVVGKRWNEHVRKVHACFGLLDVAFTKGPGDATTIVRKAIAEGAERIVAVGGDGTVNECLNGFAFADDKPAAAQLAVFPLGTGGDFARSIGMRDADVERLALDERLVDVGRVTNDKGERYFLNVASFGASGLVVEKVNTTSKRFGAKASFMLGTLKGLTQYRNQRVRLRIDDTFEEEILANTVAVANGRYFGGGMKVAPEASLADGQLEVVVIGDIGVGFFVRHSGKIYAGTHGTLPEVRMFRGANVLVTPLSGDSDIPVDCDGEQMGKAPVRFEVLPKRLKLLAPWTRAEA